MQLEQKTVDLLVRCNCTTPSEIFISLDDRQYLNSNS